MQKLFYGLKSDENLMLSYQKGKHAAFEVLYARHKDGLVAFLFRQTGRESLVEDLAQETWIALVNSAARYQVKAKFRTYLFQLAHNKWVDYLRRESVRPMVNALTSVASDQDGDRVDSILLVEDQTSDPEMILHESRRQGILNQAILGLAQEQRDVFLLREDGFSQDEIATIVGVGRETVKSRLRYAKKHLRLNLVSLTNEPPNLVVEASHAGARS